MNDAISTLRQQLAQLKSLHDSGTLDKKAYEAAKAPLERKLLDQVMQAPVATEAPARPSWNLLGLLTVLIFIGAGSGYLYTGSPGMPSAGEPGSQTQAEASDPHAMDSAQFAEAVAQMAERMQNEPDNLEGWSILARSYARLGQLDQAIAAFERAIKLAPKDARLLADLADSVALKNDRSLEGRPTELINQALKLEPENPKALALAGTAAFNRKDYKAAVKHWELLEKVTPGDAGFMSQLQTSIAEARSLGGMPARAAAPSVVPTATAAPADAPKPTAEAAAAGPVVTGSVKLSPALAGKVSPDDVVFVFARPAEGSRMPLAILRHQVKELPVSFRLDDGMAMSPAAKMSLFPKLIISARISKSGQAVPANGDLIGESAPVANDARDVVVEIKSVVGQ